MPKKRALRWQLYDQATEQGLKRRSGGYTVQFLRNFLLKAEAIAFDPTEALFNKFAPLGNFIQAVDIFEQNKDIKTISQARTHHRDVTGLNNRFTILKATSKRIDKAAEALGLRNKPRRGSKPWSQRKREFIERHGLSPDEWREYKRNKLNAQRSSA